MSRAGQRGTLVAAVIDFALHLYDTGDIVELFDRRDDDDSGTISP
jgi:hypothetical protein